jgi:hypothetical protein
MLVSYRATDIIARPFTGRYYRERQNVVIHEFRNASDPGFQSPFKTMMVGRLTVIEPDRDAYTVSVTDGQVLIVGRGRQRISSSSTNLLHGTTASSATTAANAR